MKKLFESMNSLKDNRNGKVVTFDFDNTVVKSFYNTSAQGEEIYQFGGVNKEVIKRIAAFKKSGTTVFIVTSRDNALDHEDSSVENLVRRLQIEVDGIFYTNGQTKAQRLYELGSRLHYDDDPKEHDAIKSLRDVYPDFDIVVKFPDKLIKDIEEIAKGIIVTSDGKFIVAQRSDSYEWDSIGGHLMEGEEAPFAFWRETKEEMGLEVEEVTWLDTTETTWKGVTKPSHYFVGKTGFSSIELEHEIDLQWELASYFCGTIEEIDEKCRDNMTKNLENVLNLVDKQSDLLDLEEIQERRMRPHEKGHKRKKKRIIGLGGSKTTGAKGLTRVKDFSRSKSAPPGFGVLEEESDDKPTKKIKISIISDIDERKKRKKRKKKKKTTKKKGNYWPYWGFSTDSDGSDGGGDGGGGE
jgi:8-oxo-dGTP pyrophosphatase MutT (NUDIX family)